MRYFTTVGNRINIEWEMGVRSGSPLSALKNITDAVSRMSRDDVETLQEKCERRKDGEENKKVELEPSFSPVRLYTVGDMIVVRASCMIRLLPIAIQALENQGFIFTGD